MNLINAFISDFSSQQLMIGTVLVFLFIGALILMVGGSDDDAIDTQHGGEQASEKTKLSAEVLKRETNRLKRDAARAATTSQKQEDSKVKKTQSGGFANYANLQTALDNSSISITMQGYYLMSLGAALIFIAINFVMTKNFLLSVLFSLPSAYFVPRWIIRMIIQRRHKSFIALFPTTLDGIVRGVRSGLPVSECFRMIAEDAQEPMKSEFRLVVARMSLGVPIQEAVKILSERIPIPETRFFGIAIAIQQQSGGSIAETLTNLSRILRMRKVLRDKVVSATAEAKISAIIIGLLPFLVAALITFINPTYMDPLLNEVLGQIVLAGAGLWMLIGLVFMVVLINFKI